MVKRVEEKKTALNFFQRQYLENGLNAQRRYPNEEFCRFMGRNFFSTPIEKRNDIKILEVGCGSGANLWMIANEGFHAIGVDISSNAIELCEQMLSKYMCSASLHVADMTSLPVDLDSLDCVVDVFSSHCLDSQQGKQFINSVSRSLKKGGKFFSYFPSKQSDTWKLEIGTFPDSSKFVDADTLNGLQRKDGPFFGNSHPFRFLEAGEYRSLIEDAGLSVHYCEVSGRTYRQSREYFEFIVVEAIKL